MWSVSRLRYWPEKKKTKPRLTQINSKGVFTWENLHRHKFHTSMAFWCCVISYLGYLKVHFMLITYTCDSKSQTLRMRYPFQSTGRPISHGNGWWTKGKHKPSGDACLKSRTRIRRPAQAGLACGYTRFCNYHGFKEWVG